MTTLSVVIPALNEEDGIQEIMDRVLSTRQALQVAGIDELELIVVDDGSTDATPQIVTATEGATLIVHPVNRGYGAALKTGYAAGRGELIGFLDADGTYPPEYFPELVKVGLAEDADIVIGSRMAGADSEMPKVRRLGNIIFANLVSLISAQRITDSASGMRVFKKSILPRIYPLPDGLNLTPVMSTRALHEDLKMVEVPIPYSERVGRSKLSVVHDGMRFAQSIVWTALSYNPVRPLGLIGLGALGLSALIAIMLIILRLQGVTSLGAGGAYITFSAVVLAVAGISIMALGMSFNYFVALFHHEPIRQGIFGRPTFERKIEPHFGWMGLVAFLAGLVVGLGALFAGMGGLEVQRLWFYYLASAGMALVGMQLMIAWVQMQVLQTLSRRDALVLDDLGDSEPEMPMARNIEVGAD
jgi:glycosyltransferase involved in cell wall biosynthesis